MALHLSASLQEVDDYVRRLREQIDRTLPPGAVVPMHTDQGHFYRAPSGNTYPSVTGKLGAVKDESIQNWAMNEALRHVEQNLHTAVKDGQVHIPSAIDLFAEAKRVPKGLLHAAGDIGTQVHDRREQYFQAWIDSDKITSGRPPVQDFLKENDDPRLVASMLGLDKFLTATNYIPVRTEVMVYSDEYKVGGMLDDLGIMKHNGKWKFTLMDLKTSNQMKAHYWLQVALYNMMFRSITGLKPEVSCILKVSKEYPDYSVEYIDDMRRVVAGAKSVLKVYDIMEYIRDQRKDVGKNILTI